MSKVVIITGISSGMGHAAAVYFKEQGWEVYGGARRVEKLTDLIDLGVHAQSLDVTNEESVQALVDTVINEQGRIDALINNAGYGEFGPLEEVTLENAKKQFDVNVFGAASITKKVLPIMRQQQSGRIINISSIGGDLYMPLGGWYHATKASIDMFSDVLDVEVRPFGIRSVVVQPGGTASEWSDIAMTNTRKNLSQGSAYEPLVNRFESLMSRLNGRATATSEDLAKVFYRAATDSQAKRRYYNAFSDRMIVHIARSHPNIFKRVLTRVSRTK